MQLVAVINSKTKISSAVLFISLGMLSACNENIAQGDKLSPAERAYLRTLAAAKCVADSDSVYKSLENASNNNMLNMERNQTWKYEYKKDGAVIETSYLYVWKVAPPIVYFRLNLTEAGITSNKFFKVDTSANVDMWRTIQTKSCDKTFTATGSGSKTVNIDIPKTRIDTETQTDGENDYRLLPTYPAYFGNLNRLYTKRTLNNKDVVTKTEKFDYVISTNAATVQPLTYNDATITNRSYCMARFTAPVAPSTYDTYAFPFDLDCATTDADATKPDANGDALSDFSVAELAGPF